MIGRLARGVLLACCVARGARGQTIQIRDAGQGDGPAYLAASVSRPHLTIAPSAGDARIPHDSTLPRTTIVLGRSAYVDGTVHGDLIVVGGDLFMHPGGRIDGRAVAYGGGVYESSLATIGGGTASYRDFSYDISNTPDGYALTYRTLVTRSPSVLGVLGPIGTRVPTYDRANGLSLPLLAAFDRGRGIEVVPSITYRSQLGAIDPAVAATVWGDRPASLSATIGRSTYSNETWISSDLVNSAEALFFGEDARNYFRAWRGELSYGRAIDDTIPTIAPTIGLRWEKAKSVRPDTGARGGPWSFFGRHDRDDMLRPNPRIDEGTIISALGGLQSQWGSADLRSRLDGGLEIGAFAPDRSPASATTPTSGFAQLTLDGRVAFPTFGAQSLSFDGHAVASLSSNTPRQRWAYVGGSGTIPTLSMLERGGDDLLYFNGSYNVPIERIQLPIVGAPVVSLREILAGAAVHALPSLEQAVGVRVSAGPAHVEFLFDPVKRHGKLSAGLSVIR